MRLNRYYSSCRYPLFLFAFMADTLLQSEAEVDAKNRFGESALLEFRTPSL